jgi:hypothetical protein
MYEYLRHPGIWSEVESNILRYKHLVDTYPANFGISYTHTIGWLNAWYVPEFHSWAEQNTPNFRIWDNIIHWPRHMSLVMLPRSAKDKIIHKWKNYDWKEYASNIEGIINFMTSEQPSNDEIKLEYKKFVLHDEHRNENIFNVIPVEILEDVRDLLYVKD